MKKISLLLISVILMVCMLPGAAFANDSFPNDDLMESAIVPLSIANSGATIGNSGKAVTYSGSARYTNSEPSIAVTITLQEKRGNTWYNIDSRSKSASNTYTISLERTKSVSGGYYYRCKAVFSATNSGATTKYSSSKWVS